VPSKFLFIKGTLFLAGNHLLNFGNPGQRLPVSVGVRTPEPQTLRFPAWYHYFLYPKRSVLNHGNAFWKVEFLIVRLSVITDQPFETHFGWHQLVLWSRLSPLPVTLFVLKVANPPPDLPVCAQWSEELRTEFRDGFGWREISIATNNSIPWFSVGYLFENVLQGKKPNVTLLGVAGANQHKD